MSVTSSGANQQPQFTSSGNSPTFAADLTAVSDYAAAVGNRKVGSTASRTSYAADAWEGLQWEDTTTGLPYNYKGGWVPAVDLVKYVDGTASLALPVASGWINLAATTTIPAAPFGTGVNYTVEVEGFTTQSPGSGGGFAIRCHIDAAAMTSGGQAQLYSVAGDQSTLTTRGFSTITTPNVSHTVAVQICSLEAASTVVSGSAISGYRVIVKRTAAL